MCVQSVSPCGGTLLCCVSSGTLCLRLPNHYSFQAIFLWHPNQGIPFIYLYSQFILNERIRYGESHGMATEIAAMPCRDWEHFSSYDYILTRQIHKWKWTADGKRTNRMNGFRSGAREARYLTRMCKKGGEPHKRGTRYTSSSYLFFLFFFFFFRPLRGYRKRKIKFLSMLTVDVEFIWKLMIAALENGHTVTKVCI